MLVFTQKEIVRFQQGKLQIYYFIFLEYFVNNSSREANSACPPYTLGQYLKRKKLSHMLKENRRNTLSGIFKLNDECFKLFWVLLQKKDKIKHNKIFVPALQVVATCYTTIRGKDHKLIRKQTNKALSSSWAYTRWFEKEGRLYLCRFFCALFYFIL